MKIASHVIMALVLVSLLGACAQKKEEDSSAAVLVAISLTQTAAPPEQPTATREAPSPTVSAASGAISGRVGLLYPPTPHMTVYAMDVKSGRWASTETAPADGLALFSLAVQSGSYQVFAFADDNKYAGYSADGSALTLIDVAENQTVADVILKPPSQYECGPLYGVPASPDNRFKAVSGPSENCAATAQAARFPATPASQGQRIQFAPGAASTRIQASIPAAGRRYVLSAMGGQEMTVSLSTPGNPNLQPFFFVIQGADWTTLVPYEQRWTQWSGVLPSTQDYYIDIVSTLQVPADCIMDIAIAPLRSNVQTLKVRLKSIPDGFEGVAGLSPNVMLPAYFPVAGGLPEVVPDLLWADDGNYDVSLDYGEDCQGAGACHYGSLSGMKIYSVDLQDTPNFTYEGERAHTVSLANDIPGYYIEGQCGASCDDSRVFWIYNGYQYMLGLKGAPQDTVLSLADATIQNSLQ